MNTRISLLAACVATALAVAACSEGPEFAAANGRPTISAVNSSSLVSGAPSTALAFTVGDAESNAADLRVTATSSNFTVCPLNRITFGGSGANRTITVNPVNGTAGVCEIVVSVGDPQGQTASTAFTLTFQSVAFTAFSRDVFARAANSPPATTNAAYTFDGDTNNAAYADLIPVPTP
jgi:hypothetical protein